MASTEIERTRELARNLVQLLTAYEEELILLEQTVPSIGQLRRAVGTAIAEACYVITDEGVEGDMPGPTGESRTWGRG
jgi:hypothetical protein